MTNLLKRGATWSHLKPTETSWNQLKPPRNDIKPPETAWNQPYYSIFFRKISYDQVEFVLILNPKIFWGQILFQKLKFSKLTKIWYRCTLLYPYFEFNFYSSKVFISHIFSGKFGPKIWSSSNWLKFGTEVDCYILILILMFIFSTFLLFIFFRQIWS